MQIPQSLKQNIPIEQLTSIEAEAELKYLAYILEKYNKAYYLDDNPLVGDSKYDSLFRRNENLEIHFPLLKLTNSPSQKVGAVVTNSKLKKISHKTPMLSLSNCFSITEVADFIKRAKKFLSIKFDTTLEIVCEPKIDGASFSAFFYNGVLEYVATRGDGITGEDITENVKTIKDFPLKIDTHHKQLEIRGEIFITKDDFEKINKERDKENLPLFANPRNAAAGSLRQLDHSITSKRNLKYFAYAISFTDINDFITQDNILHALKKMGFVICNLHSIASSVEEIENFYNELYNKRAGLPYDIDGIVYKINQLSLQTKLGTISRSPRFATAHKFPAEQAKTVITDITIQVGRTGALTPVAELQAVNVGGVIVKRASLHNKDEIERKDIMINDTVIIERAGDVIPHIISVDKNLRHEHCKKFSFPEHCPVCQSDLIREPDEAIIRCTGGLSCSAQKLEHFKHFVSRNAFNIEGLGEKQIEFLYDNNYISNILDIFDLQKHTNDLAVLPNWGLKSVSNLINSINKSKNTTLERLIYSLGIRYIGETTSRLLANHFKTFEKFLYNIKLLHNNDYNTFAQLDQIDNIGIKTSESLQKFCHQQQNIWLIEELGKIIEIEEIKKNIHNNFFTNKKLVFTGTLEHMTRPEAKHKALTLGAQVQSSVSKNTDILIAGNDAGSKSIKARELGIKIINEEEWLNLLKQTND
ncbi:MAG: NAD-dependent DNA ligase LigA [Rickettsiales bacterium]|nr:NAD-dependent DNA ligase LigA [Rickettsiales bacterium]